MSDSVSKSWFCVFNNPEEHGYTGSPEEIIDRLRDEWVSDRPTRTGAWTYCVSADGLKHIHMVLEDQTAMRFSVIKKSYAVGMHFEPTKGSRDDAENYINKRGKYAEKGEKVIAVVKYGEIKGAQGMRRDLDTYVELVDSGYTPLQIFRDYKIAMRYETFIRSVYWQKRREDTPAFREVAVYWHVGESGTGKSHTYLDLIDKYGRDRVYMVSNYENGFLDTYEAEPVLFLDEYRGQLRYSYFLSVLDGYTNQFPCRYKNVYMVWNEVHITSVKTPEEVYQNLISDDSERKIDTYEQLRRRINYIVYHWKDSNGFHERQIPMDEFRDRSQFDSISGSDGFIQVSSSMELPFE